MKRKTTVGIVVLIVLFHFAASQSFGFVKGVSLKLSTGLGFPSIGDLNLVIQGTENAWDNNLLFYDFSKSGGLKNLSQSTGFGGDLIFHITPIFGVAVGTEYLNVSKDSEVAWSHPLYGQVDITMSPQIRVVPAKLSAYVFIPFGYGKIVINGGGGWYFAKGDFSCRQDYEVEEDQGWAENSGDFKGGGPGFFGSLGIEFPVFKGFNLFLEGVGRFIKIKNLKGTGTSQTSESALETTEGNVWYTEWTNNGDAYYASLLYGDEPADTNLINVRRFQVNLSGFELKVGIRIRF